MRGAGCGPPWLFEVEHLISPPLYRTITFEEPAENLNYCDVHTLNHTRPLLFQVSRYSHELKDTSVELIYLWANAVSHSARTIQLREETAIPQKNIERTRLRIIIETLMVQMEGNVFGYFISSKCRKRKQAMSVSNGGSVWRESMSSTLRRRHGVGDSKLAMDSAAERETSMARTLRAVDVYAKVEEDLQVKTETGAAVTIAFWVLMLVLIVGEVHAFLKERPAIERVVVDTTMGQRLRINTDIVSAAGGLNLYHSCL